MKPKTIKQLDKEFVDWASQFVDMKPKSTKTSECCHSNNQSPQTKTNKQDWEDKRGYCLNSMNGIHHCAFCGIDVSENRISAVVRQQAREEMVKEMVEDENFRIQIKDKAISVLLSKLK